MLCPSDFEHDNDLSCPLFLTPSGDKQTIGGQGKPDAFDPNRTWGQRLGVCLESHCLSCGSNLGSIQFGSRGGATRSPRSPARSIARCTNPDALASSMNSLM